MITVTLQSTKPSRIRGWAFFLVVLLPAGAAGEETKIRFTIERGKPMVVEVVGVPEADFKQLKDLQMPDFAAILSVRVAGGKTNLLGNYAVTDNSLRFESRHSPGPGITFRAVYDPATFSAKPTGRLVSAEATVPKGQGVATAVVAKVYPSGDQLPENLLRIYLHFSAPMSRHDAYSHVRLLDEKGKEVTSPFLELGEELWDPTVTRFTLLLHPGRIKRGLKPREELGPILEEGKRYTLVVSASWPDAEGNPLKSEFRKSFRVGTPDETQPDPKKWSINPPAAGGRGALTITLEKPADQALLERLLWLVDAGGRRVPGAAAVTEGETRWTFTPARPWAAGHYRLMIDTALEDRAGNSIARPFELDLVQPRPQGKARLVDLNFEVK